MSLRSAQFAATERQVVDVHRAVGVGVAGDGKVPAEVVQPGEIERREPLLVPTVIDEFIAAACGIPPTVLCTPKPQWPLSVVTGTGPP